MRSLASILALGDTVSDDAKAAEFDRADAERKMAARLKAARIPARYAQAELRDCCSLVESYAHEVERGSTGWLLIEGRNGRGKTHQASAVLRHLAKSRRVEFATMQGALEACKRTFDGPGSEEDVTNHYRNVPVLLLDDFGKENPTDWSLPLIFSIIDGRYSGLRPTIITTNMDASQMIDHLAKRGDRTMAESVVSRIAEARHVSLMGDDRRLS